MIQVVYYCKKILMSVFSAIDDLLLENKINV